MLSSLALALALMTTPSSDTHPICVQRFDAELRPTRSACIEVQGTMHWVHARPDGALVALATRAGGAVEMTSWSAEAGALPSTHRLDVSGELRVSRLREDGDLVVIVGKDLLHVSANGRLAGRFALEEAATRTLALARDGVWALEESRLRWWGVDGSARELRLPSVAPEVPLRVPKSRVGRSVTVRPLEGGELLIAERIGDGHPVKGMYDEGDVTVRLGLTRVDRDGQVVGQRIYDESRKRLQWFWRTKDSNNPGPFPTDWGIVRTRWSGMVELVGADPRPGGNVVVTVERDDEKPRLVAFDREFREMWSRALPIPAIAGPPSWSRGLLFADAHGELFFVDDAGRHERRGEIPVPPPFRNTSYDSASIGQTASGEWWIAIW